MLRNSIADKFTAWLSSENRIWTNAVLEALPNRFGIVRFNVIDDPSDVVRHSHQAPLRLLPQTILSG